MKWTVAIMDREFIVNSATAYAARCKGAKRYNQTEGTKFPEVYLRSIARVKRHEDKRVRISTFTGAPSILEIERQRELARYIGPELEDESW